MYDIDVADSSRKPTAAEEISPDSKRRRL